MHLATNAAISRVEMLDAQPPAILPPATVQAILAATGKAGPFAPSLIEALGGWLGAALNRAISRARRKRITQADVDDMAKAYREFRKVIDSLQHKASPPPRIPRWIGMETADGSVPPDAPTAWERWLAGHEAFGVKLGRPDGRAWGLIAELLALYETISGNRATAGDDRNPTTWFLDTALVEMAKHAPPDVRSKLEWPGSEAMKKQMPRLRRNAIEVAARSLDRAIQSTR